MLRQNLHPPIKTQRTEAKITSFDLTAAWQQVVPGLLCEELIPQCSTTLTKPTQQDRWGRWCVQGAFKAEVLNWFMWNVKRETNICDRLILNPQGTWQIKEEPTTCSTRASVWRCVRRQLTSNDTWHNIKWYFILNTVVSFPLVS